jgi:hypothetical protein
MVNRKRPHPQRAQDDPDQSKRFVEAAREAEADETEVGADKAFKKVVSRSIPKVSSPDDA